MIKTGEGLLRQGGGEEVQAGGEASNQEGGRGGTESAGNVPPGRDSCQHCSEEINNMILLLLQCQERSEFYSMVDLSKVPVLYTPSPGQQSQATILGEFLSLS